MPKASTVKAFLACQAELRETIGREPTVEELSVEFGRSIKDIEWLLNVVVEAEDNDDFQLRFRMSVKNEELYRRRIAKGLKQVEVDEKLGIAKQTYSRIENCYLMPHPDLAQEIANLFGAPVEVLFPKWLEAFSKQWVEAEREKAVSYKYEQIESPTVLSLTAGDPIEQAEQSMKADVLRQIMKGVLTPRERRIIEARFYEGKTYGEIGKEFDVTRERIRQKEAKALSRLNDARDLIN